MRKRYRRVYRKDYSGEIILGITLFMVFLGGFMVTVYSLGIVTATIGWSSLLVISGILGLGGRFL